jgi:[acyl-carrier-protein] S-malonyltransferase
MEALLLPGLAPSAYTEVDEFINRSPHALKRFSEASSVIGYSLIDAFREAGDKDYEVKECAFLANSVALMDHYTDLFGSKPEFTIGPSFGVMGAAVSTQTLTYDEAVWLTYESAKVSKLFYNQLKGDYHTHFIYNLSLKEALSIVENFNSENKYLELVGYLEKVVCLCGPAAVISDLKDYLNNKPKCFSLHTMKQPIHSSCLKPLHQKLKKGLFNEIKFKPLRNTFISDVSGELINDPEEFKQSLLDGYDNPVRWDLVKKQIVNLELKDIYVVGPKNLFIQLLKNDVNTIEISPEKALDMLVET